MSERRKYINTNLRNLGNAGNVGNNEIIRKSLKGPLKLLVLLRNKLFELQEIEINVGINESTKCFRQKC